mgnify:CR=1 FL=1
MIAASGAVAEQPTVEDEFDAEDLQRRKQIAEAAHQQISRYFPRNEPTEFWRQNLVDFGA